MLKFLLDEHISSRVADGLRRRNNQIIVRWIAEWEAGRFLGQDDAFILHEAASQGLTLVTYDRKTIPPLLKASAESGRDHGGVIFVDEKTIPPANFGGLIRGLSQLWTEAGQTEWVNRVYFLRR